MKEKSKRPESSKSLTFLLNTNSSPKHLITAKQSKLNQKIGLWSLHKDGHQQSLQKKLSKYDNKDAKQKQKQQKLSSRKSLNSQHNQKWSNIAARMNNQLHLQKVIYNRHGSVNLLTRYGNKLYGSTSKQKELNKSNTQNKLNQFQQFTQDKKRQKIEQLKTSKTYLNSNKKGIQQQQSMKKYLKLNERKNLKKRSKLSTKFQQTLIAKQLSINKIFYQNPVKKIGFNMQYEAKLRFQHLTRLQQYKTLYQTKTNSNKIVQNSIIFYLKDSPFSAHIITEKNCQTPICISLFPQFFHSKLTSSNYIRQRYLQKMKQKMNNTYDPEQMAKMSKVTSYQVQFNQQAYIKILRQFINNFQDSFDPKWAQSIIRRLKRPLKHQQTSKFLRQIWDLFNKSNAISNLDYILKDQTYIKKFNVAPYLNTRHIASKKILYHGGYSRQLYPSWCVYVKHGKKNITPKLRKYNQITQSLWNWFINFQQLSFFEINFIRTLNRPLSISLFKKIQQTKMQHTKNFLKHVWMRGVILIYQHQYYLQTQKEQYFPLQDLNKLKQCIIQLKRQINEKKYSLKMLSAIQQKIYQSYKLNLKSQIQKKNISALDQFQSIHFTANNYQQYYRCSSSQFSVQKRNQNLIIPPLIQLKTPLTIHYSSIVQKSLINLKLLISQASSNNSNLKNNTRTHNNPILGGLNFTQNQQQTKKKASKSSQPTPILKLTMIVDRQNIKFRQKQQQIIQIFGQLIKQMLNCQIQTFKLNLNLEQYRVSGFDNIKTSENKKGDSLQKQKQIKQLPKNQTILNSTLKKQLKFAVDLVNNNNSNNSKNKKDENKIRNSTQNQIKQTTTSISSFIQQMFLKLYPQIQILQQKSLQEQKNKNNRQNYKKSYKKSSYESQQHEGSMSQQQKITIRYPYAHNHQREINSIIYKIHDYYKQSLQIITIFQPFLPFIKLTTSKYIFHQSQNIGKQPQQIFKKDIQIINQYRQQLNRINLSQNIKIFQINCQQPIKQLIQRINQIQYLIEQKYLNKIFDEIHLIEKSISAIKSQIQQKEVKITNVDQLEDKIDSYEDQILQIQKQIFSLSKKVMFSIDMDRSTTTLVLRYQQLIQKKKDIVKQLKNFKQSIKNSKPELQKKIKKQSNDIGKQMQQLKAQLHSIQTFYIQLSEVQNFLKKIQNLQKKISFYEQKMKQYLQSAQYVFPLEDVEQKLSEFQRFKNNYNVIKAFWKGVFKFQNYLKLKYKEKVKNINIADFQEIVSSSSLIIASFNQQKQKSQSPLLNKCQQHYLQKFTQDLQKCSFLRPIINIISNKTIQQRHWQQFRLQKFTNITLFELIKIFPQKISINQKQITQYIPQYKALQQIRMCAQVQYKIFTTFNNIKKSLKSQKIKIIDVNGSDVLDISYTEQILQSLYNWKIQLQNLSNSQNMCKYFEKDIQQLLDVIDCAYVNLIKWGQIEKNYIKITNYYVPNQQNIGNNSFQLFDQLRQLHRKLIKSFDLNASIWYISQNIILPIYNNQIQKKISELDKKIQQIMFYIRNKYPRLYLLSNQQLLLMMSSGTKIQKYVSKCFRFIEQIDIKQGAIERIGKKKHLKFLQPMYILDKLSMVYQWLPKFQETIKKNMKDLYKTNFLSILTNSKKPLGFIQHYPMQLAILDQYIDFTRMIEDSITSNSLNFALQKIKRKIYQSIKATTNGDTTFTLLFIKFRQTISQLIEQQVGNVNDFTWYKHAHFYSPNSLTNMQPRIAIMNQLYEYGFNYFQNPQILFHSNIFYGNTLIGEQKTGKKALCKYYSYITGYELLVFDPQIQFREYKVLNQNFTLTQNSSDSLIMKLIDFFKIASFTGNWLYIDKMQKYFNYEDFCVISEMLYSIKVALSQNIQKVTLMGQLSKLNKSTRIFLSLNYLSDSSLPSSLINHIRPIWVCRPDDMMLLKIYLQSKTFSYEKVQQFLSFCSWVQYKQQNQKTIIDWVRKQADGTQFRVNNLFVRLIQNGYLDRVKQILLGKNQKNDQMLSNIAKKQNISLEDQIAFISYSGMLVFGDKNIGKTQMLLRILQKFGFLYIDMRLYTDKYRAGEHIVKQFDNFRPKPNFLLIRNGLQFYRLFQQLTQNNVRLIFLQNDINFTYFSLYYNLMTFNVNSYIRKSMKKYYKSNDSQNCIAQQYQLSQYAIKNILQSQYFNKFFINKTFRQFYSIFDNHLKKQMEISNIKINYAKLLNQMLKKGYPHDVCFIFAFIWSYGNFLQQNFIINNMTQFFIEQSQNIIITHQKELQLKKIQLKNNNYHHNHNKHENNSKDAAMKKQMEKLILQINELLMTVTEWLKSGKILSLFDLMPVQNNNFHRQSTHSKANPYTHSNKLNNIKKFKNNLQVKIQFKSFFNSKLTNSVGNIYLELGTIQNIKNIRNINHQWKIKLQSRDWLSTILKQSFIDNNYNYQTIYLHDAYKMKFEDIINQILYRIKKDKCRYIFPKLKQIIIDDMHLQPLQNFVYLEHISTYKNLLYINQKLNQHNNFQFNQGKISINNKSKGENHKNNSSNTQYLDHFNKSSLTRLQLINCGFTLGTKLNLIYPTQQKSIFIKLKDQRLQNIFHQWIRSYCSANLQLDIPITHLFSVIKNISKKYEQTFSLAHYKQYPFYLQSSNSNIFKNKNLKLNEKSKNKYFWFKNPMLLALKRNPLKLSDYLKDYFKILIDILPNETEMLLALNNDIKLSDNDESVDISSQIIKSGIIQQKQAIKQNNQQNQQQPSLSSTEQKKKQLVLSLPIPVNQQKMLLSLIDKRIQSLINIQELIDSPQTDIFLNRLKQQEQFSYRINTLSILKYESNEKSSKSNNQIKIGRYLKQYILKVYRQLKYNHLVMLGQLHMQRQKILKLACKLHKAKFIQFDQKNIMKKIQIFASKTNPNNFIENKNVQLSNLGQVNSNQQVTIINTYTNEYQQDHLIVIMLKSVDITQKTLDDLTHVIKYKDFTPWYQDTSTISLGLNHPHQQILSIQESSRILQKIRFVLKINIQGKGLQQLYAKYPLLKSYFVNVYFKQTQTQKLTDLFEQIKQQRKILQNGDDLLTNDLQMDWKKDIQHLYEKYSLPKQFLIQFPQIYHKNKQSQYEKLQYYRKITSQMVVNIDRLTTYNSNIPIKLKQTTEILNKIQQKKIKFRKQIEKLKQNQQESHQQIKYIEQLLENTQINKQLFFEKIDKIIEPTTMKMDRLQRKLEGLESGQYLKLKSMGKNQHASLIILILNMLSQQAYYYTAPLLTTTQALTKQKLPLITQLSLPFTRSVLISFLKQTKKKCSRNEILQKLQIQKVQISQQKIKQLRMKIQQLKTIGIKKVQKVGVIWKYLFEWIMFHYEKKSILDDYYMKFKYSYNHIKSQLSNLSSNTQQHNNEIDKDNSLKYQIDKKLIESLFQLTGKKMKENEQEKLSSQRKDNYVEKQQKQKTQIKQIVNKKQQFKDEAIKQSLTSNFPPSSLIKQDTTAIRQKLHQQKQRLQSTQIHLSQLQQQKIIIQKNEKALSKYKRYLSQKMQNLSHVINILSDKQYMKNVSSNIASYFKNIPKISFLKTIYEFSYNEYIDDQRLQKYKLDLSHYFNVFSQDQNVRLFKMKYGLYNLTNQEIQCLYNIVVSQRKPLIIIEDRQSIIKDQLVLICQLNDYHVINSSNMPQNELQQMILKKIRNYQKILVLNSNYLNQNQPENSTSQTKSQNYQESNQFYWNKFNDFIYRCHQQMGIQYHNQQHQVQKRLIMINYRQPLIQTQFYKQTNHGKVSITFQKFMTDISQIFQLITNSQQFNNTINKLEKKEILFEKIKQDKNVSIKTFIKERYSNRNLMVSNHLLKEEQLIQKENNKSSSEQVQRNLNQVGKLQSQQIQMLINYQNSKMKHNLKNLASLTQIIIQKPYQIFHITDDQIQQRLQNQQSLIKQIQTNLSEISLIQQTLQLNCKMSSNYKDQNQANKYQINKVGVVFYWIYKYLKLREEKSQSPIFGQRQLYKEWIKCLKKLKSENHLLFNYQHEISKKFQIGMNNDVSINQNKKYSGKNNKKQNQRQPNIVSDIFKINMRQILKLLTINLCKQIIWQQKKQLYKFLILSLIIFFISIEILKCRAVVFKNIKEMIDLLLNIQKMDQKVLKIVKNVENLLNRQHKKQRPGILLTEGKQVSEQVSQVSKTLLSFLTTTKSNKNEQKNKYQNQLWVDLVKIYFDGEDTINQLVQGLKSKSKSQIYDQKALSCFDRIKSYYQIQDIIKQVFSFKHQYQLIKSVPISQNILSSNNNSKISPQNLPSSLIYSTTANVSIQLKQSQVTSSIVIIQDNQQVLSLIIQNLKYRAKLYKRDWIALLYKNQQQIIDKIKHIYQKGKTWIYLPNFSNSSQHIYNLKKLMFQLSKIPPNSTVKIFIIISSPSSTYHKNTKINLFDKSLNYSNKNLLYNKYEINKIIGKSTVNFQELQQNLLNIISLKNDQLNNNGLVQEKEKQFVMSFKTLQKIKVTQKKIQSVSKNTEQQINYQQIYSILIQSFKLLFYKYKIYHKNGIISYFMNFIKSFWQMIYANMMMSTFIQQSENQQHHNQHKDKKSANNANSSANQYNHKNNQKLLLYFLSQENIYKYIYQYFKPMILSHAYYDFTNQEPFTLQFIKKQIEISLQLKKQNLDYKKFQQKQLNFISNLTGGMMKGGLIGNNRKSIKDVVNSSEFNIQYLSLKQSFNLLKTPKNSDNKLDIQQHNNQQSIKKQKKFTKIDFKSLSPPKNHQLAKSPVSPPSNLQIHPFSISYLNHSSIFKSLLILLLQTIKSSNQIFYINSFINNIANEVELIYSTSGMNISLRNAQVYQQMQQKLMKKLISMFGSFLTKYVPLQSRTFKQIKDGIKDGFYKLRSSDQMIVIMNQFKLQKVQRMLIDKRKSIGDKIPGQTKISSKEHHSHQKLQKEYGFFLDKDQIFKIIEKRYYLKQLQQKNQVLIQKSSILGSKQSHKKGKSHTVNFHIQRSQGQHLSADLPTAQIKDNIIFFTKQSLESYFTKNQLLKQTFKLCQFNHNEFSLLNEKNRQSINQTELNSTNMKTTTKKNKPLALNHQQIEQIMKNFVLILEFKNCLTQKNTKKQTQQSGKEFKQGETQRNRAKYINDEKKNEICMIQVLMK